MLIKTKNPVENVEADSPCKLQAEEDSLCNTRCIQSNMSQHLEEVTPCPGTKEKHGFLKCIFSSGLSENNTVVCVCVCAAVLLI